MSIFFLVGGLTVILLSANALVGGASSLAKRFNISDLVIGLTIVSIGTSTPELAISVISAVKGNTDIAVGNVLGSNIANILLILGISAIVYPLTVQKNTQYKEIPLGLLAVVLIGFMGNDIFFDNADSNIISRIDGIVLLCFFIVFLYYIFQIATNNEAEPGKIQQQPVWKSVSLVVLGIAGLYFGGKYFVEGAIDVAHYFGMSDSLIGLTIVAIGTSLPELATSIVAAYKKNPDIAVGNVVGSNILNVFFILGITATIKPLPLNISTNFDIAVAVIAALLLFMGTFLFQRRIVTRTEGIFFVTIYVSYLIYIVLNQ
jgi:cation:H+ antiporter